MFNMKNKLCQEAFKEETEVNEELVKCFENELLLEVQSRKWLKSFNPKEGGGGHNVPPPGTFTQFLGKITKRSGPKLIVNS